MKKQLIVTRESLMIILNGTDRKKIEKLIGRALLVLLDRQTADEQSDNVTSHTNNMGFAQCDAFTGTNCAKFYKTNGYLRPWMITAWSKVNPHGFARITKYHKQLNEVAEQKRATLQTELKQVA